jgi:hypothetical protein
LEALESSTKVIEELNKRNGDVINDGITPREISAEIEQS